MAIKMSSLPKFALLFHRATNRRMTEIVAATPNAMETCINWPPSRLVGIMVWWSSILFFNFADYGNA